MAAMEKSPSGSTGMFSEKETAVFKDQFAVFDVNGDGSIDTGELRSLMKKIGENPTDEVLRKLIAEVDTDKSGTIEFGEFLAMVAAIRSGKGTTTGLGNVYQKAQKMNVIKTAAGHHSFSDEEKIGFVEYINSSLKSDAFLNETQIIPINPDNNDLFTKVANGILLCKLINLAVPDTVDERALNIKKKLNEWEMAENQNMCVQSAKGIGVNVVNLGAGDLKEGRPHLVLGLVWQIIRIGLLNSITLKNHPYLIRLLEEGEQIADLLKLAPDQILLRWFNYHLKAAGSEKRVTNFSGDIKDSTAYTILLHQIAPNLCDDRALKVTDLLERAGIVLENADKLECRKFVRPKDFVSGNQKLNLAFVATLFNTWPALEPVEEAALKDLFDDENDAREERAFRMWMNSLGVQPEVHLLYEDLRDGLILLQLFNKLQPGIVDWTKVTEKPNNVFKKTGNTNYAVALGKQMKFSLVGIAGKDITDGNRKLTLALVWQMMRFYVLDLCRAAATKLGKAGTALDEADMVKWANSVVEGSKRPEKIDSLKDQKADNCIFWIALIAGLSPKSVKWDVVHQEPEKWTAEEAPKFKMENAKYAISVARKFGATVFILWEDLVEVKPKLVLTFLAAIMARSA